MTRTVCKSGLCSGCRCCTDACTHNAITYVDSLERCDAVIDEDKCIGCGMCERVCPIANPAIQCEPLNWVQGWAVQDEVRSASSSGGLAVAVSRAFVQDGGVVCSCAFESGRFGFEAVKTVGELGKFCGSKYVKSDASGAYQRTRDLLRSGYRVLFIGLPCQVSAMRRFAGSWLGERLYTVDLICHGTPSSQTLDLFLNQHGVGLDDLEAISFRSKSGFRLRDGERRFATPGVCDSYTLAFLDGVTYTEGCYSCPFAKPARVGDITLGDSWGTNLSDEEAAKGISLVLCQTEKGRELLEAADLKLVAVDAKRAQANNGQLNKPSVMPRSRTRFFADLKAGKTFDRAVWRALPKQMFKQRVKAVLIRLHLYKPAGGGSLMYSITVVPSRAADHVKLKMDEGK